ncbi:hypothetical protein Fcan01_10994 [Folsomia candida]|uniref:Uncharacterized protein n=1 Tax=Folsomia candida TaxID=158441 RepID=A0A226EAM2_FOLCA|nr:hypothetical protein Fcan01_10994 [Folsomia candida]
MDINISQNLFISPIITVFLLLLTFTPHLISTTQVLSIHSEIGLIHILEIFSNCTTVLDNGRKSVGIILPNLSTIQNPAVLVDSEISQSGYNSSQHTIRISMTRRTNVKGHCWSFITLFPENYLELINKRVADFSYALSDLLRKSYHIDRVLYKPQYIVWLTLNRSELQNSITNLGLNSISQYGSHNLVFISAKMTPYGNVAIEMAKFQLEIHCYNRYFPAPLGNSSLPWVTISCRINFHLSSCFNQLSTFTRDVSHLNKFFWTVEAWRNTTKSGLGMDLDVIKYVKDKFFSRNRKSNNDLEIARLTTFDAFIGFWIFSDVLQTSEFKLVQNLGTLHYLPVNQEFRLAAHNFHSVIPIRLKSWSFLSCHGVGHHTSAFAQLFTPFQKIAWVFVAFSIFVILTFLNVPKFDSCVTFLVVGIILENSVLLSYDEMLPRNWRKHSFRVCSGFFSLIFGTLLTNWYKTSFTKEMIIPTEQTAPWRTIFDIKNLTFYIPYETLMTPDEVKLLGQFGLLDHVFYSALVSKLGARADCSAFERFQLSAFSFQLLSEFANSLNLKVHVEARHAANKELIHSCDKCEHKNHSKHNLAMHAKWHKPANHKCYFCGRKFVTF